MKKEVIPTALIAQSIHFLRGQKVIFDDDLGRLYGVTTGNLNKAVRRNRDRFPSDFMFQLTTEEVRDLRCQIGISNQDTGSNLIFQIGRSKGRGGRRHLPYAFTEQGVAMPSSVLKSDRAVKVNIAIMRAFVNLRETLETNRELARKFAELEKHVGERTRLACWRWRPRHRELPMHRSNPVCRFHWKRCFSASRRKVHASRVRSPNHR